MRKYGDRGHGGVGGDGVDPVCDRRLKLGGLVDLASIPVLDNAFIQPDFGALLTNGDLFTDDFEYLWPTVNKAGDMLTYCTLKKPERLELAQMLVANTVETRLGPLASPPPPADLNVPVWESVCVPALLINCKKDAVLTPEAFLAFKELLPRAKTIEYCESGHLPQYEVPRKLNHDLKKFIKSIKCKRRRCHGENGRKVKAQTVSAAAAVKPQVIIPHAWKKQ